MPRITKQQIDKIFDAAKHQQDYVLGLYRLVYGDDWPRVKKVLKWPMIGKEAFDHISARARIFDQEHHPSCIAGGAWLNNGFACMDWGEVVLGDTEWNADGD